MLRLTEITVRPGHAFMQAGKQMFILGDWKIYPDTCTLSNGELDNKVTPRSMDVLVYLTENAGEVVSSSELLDKFWQGTSTSDHAVHKVVAELRSALGDNAHQPQFIKTVPKRGYTLLQTALTEAQTLKSVVNPITSRIRNFKSSWSMLSLAAALAVLITVSWSKLDLADNPDNAEIRLAVLPFLDGTGSNPDTKVLVDGLSTSLVTGLASLDQIHVLAPASNSSASREIRSAQQLGAELNVDHVLAGNVLYADNKARVTVHLIRVADGVHQYAEQFDLESRDIFQVHDKIVANIVTSLSIHLDEQQRSQMMDWGTTNAVAYAQFLQGEFHNNQFNPADFELAIDHHLNAIAEDPNFMNAYLGVVTAANNYAVFGTAEKIQELTDVIDQMHTAVAKLDPDSEILKSIRAVQLRVRGSDYRLQESKLREEILSGTAPEFALAHYALFLIGARMYDEALQFLNIASELDPFEISPDEIWDYKVIIETPENLILQRKQQLQERPKHLGILGAVARNLLLIGREEEARSFAEKQKALDSEGISSHYTSIFIGALTAESSSGNDTLQYEYRNDVNYNFNNGILSFMRGDIENGVKFWKGILPVHKRRLINTVHSSETLFADGVVQDPAYQQLLNELDFGLAWQRTLMEGVLAMQTITGVGLSDTARSAYENKVLMSKNNLWTAEQWAQLDQYKQQHLHNLSAESDLTLL